jgi:hypothetical protein
VGFEGDWSDASWFEEREADAMREQIGRAPPRRWLQYVWTGRGRTKGEQFGEPYRPETIRCVALRGGDDATARWFDEDVDPRADYARAFGSRAPAIIAVMVMTDADDTRGVAGARYADLRLVAQ